MIDDSFEFVLNKPISGGNIKVLVLYEPSNIHKPIVAVIDSMARSGILKLANNTKPAEEVDIKEDDKNIDPFSSMDGDQIISYLKMVPSENYDFYSQFCNHFKNLFLSDNICKVKDTNNKITIGYYDAISSKDGDHLIGEYFKNFFTISTSS